MQRLSLYEEGRREAERHKWIESQKRGRDLGIAALVDWFHRHWPRYCRFKCVAHLSGNELWVEFGDSDFGLLDALARQDDLLLDRILDRVRNGKENLDLILWAREWGLPMDRVIQVLTDLNLNRAHLDPGGCDSRPPAS